MKSKELRWLVDEIVRLNREVLQLNSILKREDNSCAKTKENFVTLEGQYNNLKETYEVTLKSNFELQNRLNNYIENHKETVDFLNKMNDIANKQNVPCGTSILAWTIDYIKELERSIYSLQSELRHAQ